MKVYDSLILCTKYVRNFVLKVIHIFLLPACVCESWKRRGKGAFKCPVHLFFL